MIFEDQERSELFENHVIVDPFIMFSYSYALVYVHK